MNEKDTPWTGDACSLVDAFRSGDRTPVEELEATFAAIEASELNAFSFIATETARAAAADADVSQPFGGVPVGVKELDSVAGWPGTDASVPLKDRVSDYDSTNVARLRDDGGAVLVGLTTASEFGGVNLTRTKLNGITRNPWSMEATPGGSSGGAASAVAGGLITIGTGGDGGGSIRIPAGFCGLFGYKSTYGRFPGGPFNIIGSLTAVWGCLARSVRDTARWLDVCNGYDSRDSLSLARVEGWESGIGSHDLAGKRVVVVPDLGIATLHPEVREIVETEAKHLIADAGFVQVDVPVELPDLGLEWALSGLPEVRRELGDLYPDCADDLTPEIALGLNFADKLYNTEMRGRIEENRMRMNEAMAAIFDEVDFVIASTNPDVAFDAAGPIRMDVNGEQVPPQNNGALTIPSNIYGNPAVSIPVGSSRGLPVGLQVIAPHHRDGELLDVAALVERERPWPLTAPGAPL